MIEFFINDKPVKAEKGETILDVARREGFYIPTMCHLKKVTPIASCRLCVVEVEGVDGMILSCQTPVKQDIKVTTDSPALFKERQKIMQFYTVNHPLQCGVCDKSGECDLQNRTAEFKVTEQIFNAKEQRRDIEDWGNVQYDPNLCIMCERCVSVSSEIVGDNNLKITYGGYSSKISRVDATKNVSGECMAVCPVGALASKSFKYTSNAWELQKIPSVCSYCGIGCSINYEVKHGGNGEKVAPKIYRVTNEANFASLCDIGRFNYDFANQGSKNESTFNNAIFEFEKADTIRFTSKITNEEALLLQMLKEDRGYKLVNSDAYNYQKFMSAYASTAGKDLYSGSIEDVKKSDYIVVFGSQISNDLPVLKYAVNQAVKKNKAEVIYLNPIEEPELKTIVTKYIKYEVGAEEGVASLIANGFVKKDQLSADQKAFFTYLDIGYIASESNVGEEEIEDILRRVTRKKNPVLIVGKELYGHDNSENLAKILGFFEKATDFKVIIAPSDLNTIGVSRICQLDKDTGEYTIGYKAEGDFLLSDAKFLPKGAFAVPSLISQEGTIVNINRCVAPLHAALEYKGYALGDIAKALGVSLRYTTELTKKLPQEKGFKAVDFDQLEDYFDNNGTLHRGYTLESFETGGESFPAGISEISDYNGSVIRLTDFVHSKFTTEVEGGELYVSEQFVTAFKVSDGDKVNFDINGVQICGNVCLDPKLKGTIGLFTTNNLYGSKATEGYPYIKIKLERAGQ